MVPFDLWWPPSDSFDYRLTVRAGQLVVSPWNEFLLDSAAVPKHGVVAGQDVCIANLKVLQGVPEIAVSFVSGPKGGRQPHVDWALTQRPLGTRDSGLKTAWSSLIPIVRLPHPHCQRARPATRITLHGLSNGGQASSKRASIRFLALRAVAGFLSGTRIYWADDLGNLSASASRA
jgi:hypothetical protein